MEEKTHYRKAFNSPYLSSQDIVEPTVLTVSYVRLEPDKTKKSKDHFNTAYFVEKELRKDEILKPMVLNAVNSRTMKNLTGSAFIEDWNNIRVTIYVDSNVKFGRDTVEGLRIHPQPPREGKPTLEKGSKNWTNAIAAYLRDGHLDAVKKRVDIPQELENKLIAEATKNVA